MLTHFVRRRIKYFKESSHTPLNGRLFETNIVFFADLSGWDVCERS